MARKDLTVLGINDGHTSGAALVRNGKVAAAVQEERLNNIKNYSGAPIGSIEEVYRIAKIHPSETDAIAVVSLNRTYAPLKEMPLKIRFFELISPFVHSHIWSKFYVRILHRFRTVDEMNGVFVRLGIQDKEVMFVEHHRAHAAVAYYQRPWKDDTLVLTNDGAGDGLSSTVSVGHGTDIDRIAESTYYDSLGNTLYSEITGYLGMKRWEHEYKVMGMAPYGQSKYCIDKIQGLIRVNPRKPLEFENTSRRCGTQVQSILRNLLNGERFDNISAATQEHFENLLVKWVRNAVEETGIHKLACGGGLFLNVKANKRLRELEEVEDIFFYPACDDGGTPIGAALEAYASIAIRDGLDIETVPLRDLYYGQEFSNEEIEMRLKNQGLSRGPQFIDDIDGTIAEMVSRGKIVARCSGRVEWGPRALGNRSILTDPRNLSIVRKLNFAIKMRDFWMPFAASILEESRDDYLVNSGPARYMIEAFDTTERADEIVAALHPFDGTCRPQTVNDWNPGYRHLLEEFRSITGVSGILNTSFNLHGYPIVGTPETALITLKASALDAVAIGNWLVTKECV